jgi:hypothetical protein
MRSYNWADDGCGVFDLTAGSFTTATACWGSGRPFIGIEKLAKRFHLFRRLRELGAAGFGVERATSGPHLDLFGRRRVDGWTVLATD